MGRRPKVTETLYEIEKNAEKKVKVAEKRYYDIVGKAEAEKHGCKNYMYVRGGLALIGSVYPLLMSDYPTPKILYQNPQIISEEEIYTEKAKEKYKIHQHLYLDKDLVRKFGILESFNCTVNIQGPGMDMKDSVVYTFYSKISQNKYVKLWKAIKEEMTHVKYYLYEVWVRKCIFDIQEQIRDIPLKEQIDAKLKLFNENDYSMNSYMGRDVQLDINRTIEAKNGQWNILVEKYGEIAAKENLSWIADNKMMRKYNSEAIAILDHFNKMRNPTTPEENWILRFPGDIVKRLELPQNLIDLFDGYYKNYVEI